MSSSECKAEPADQVDWCLVLPPDFDADRDVSVGVIPANRFAVVHCAGDLLKEDRLPRSGYEPTSDPTMEVYRRSPVEPGWETFDNDCCLPVRPLRCR